MNPRRHPFWRVARLPWLAVVSILLVLASLNAGLGLAASGRAKLRETGESIVALELQPRRAAEILEAWRAAGALPLAREAVAWDFAFIATYAAALSIACLAFVRRAGWFRRWGNRCAWLALLAGGLDVLENVGMMEMILRAGAGQALGGWPAYTTACAAPKFLCLAPVAAFLPLAVWRAVRRESGARPFARGAGAPSRGEGRRWSWGGIRG